MIDQGYQKINRPAPQALSACYTRLETKTEACQQSNFSRSVLVSWLSAHTMKMEKWARSLETFRRPFLLAGWGICVSLRIPVHVSRRAHALFVAASWQFVLQCEQHGCTTTLCPRRLQFPVLPLLVQTVFALDACHLCWGTGWAVNMRGTLPGFEG
jgi:hypothetical protein